MLWTIGSHVFLKHVSRTKNTYRKRREEDHVLTLLEYPVQQWNPCQLYDNLTNLQCDSATNIVLSTYNTDAKMVLLVE